MEMQAYNLASNNEKKSMMAMFKKCDVNGDKMISRKEL